ncbi:MAG: GTP-binding protein, partial [Alphaproteobacteria bacterium]|nr:GTP-binding protein [Alphaproteobacteria bacterium]
MTFTIAIAGRPNVGKSTLFNRLIGKAMALVADTPGVTRDWREGEGNLHGLRFRLLDTAGLENLRPKGSLAARTAERTKEALASSHVVLLMVDGREGLTHEDKIVAREVRKTGKPVLLLVNKCEGPKMPPGFDEAAALGFECILPISATHGEGLGDLHEALLPFRRHADDEKIKESDKSDDEDEKSLHLAIVGRPNAGKS